MALQSICLTEYKLSHQIHRLDSVWGVGSMVDLVMMGEGCVPGAHEFGLVLVQEKDDTFSTKFAA